MTVNSDKEIFLKQLKEFVSSLQEQISTKDGQWTVKGFLAMHLTPPTTICSVSGDEKISSKHA